MDRVVKKKKFHPGWIIGIVLVLGLIALFSYQLLIVDKKGLKSIKADEIEIATVTEGDFQEYFLANCYVAPSRSMYIDARENGLVTKVYAQQGDIIVKEQILVELENDDLESEVALKRASIESARTDLANVSVRVSQLELQNRQRLFETDHQIDVLRDDYDKKALLYKAGGLSEKDMQKAKKELDYQVENRELLLEAQRIDLELARQESDKIADSIAIAQIDLKRLEKRITTLTILSPAFGQVTVFNASVGEMKVAGSRIAQLDIMDDLKLKANLDEYYLPQIRIGNQGSFSYRTEDGEEKHYVVSIKWISPDVRNNQFEVDFGFEKSPMSLKVGQRFTVRVELGAKRKAVLLPQGEYYQVSGGSWVYVVDASRTAAAKRDIKVGKSNPEFLEVVKGLNPGERVVISDYSGFGEAETIRLK